MLRLHLHTLLLLVSILLLTHHSSALPEHSALLWQEGGTENNNFYTTTSHKHVQLGPPQDHSRLFAALSSEWHIPASEVCVIVCVCMCVVCARV